MVARSCRSIVVKDGWPSYYVRGGLGFVLEMYKKQWVQIKENKFKTPLLKKGAFEKFFGELFNDEVRKYTLAATTYVVLFMYSQCFCLTCRSSTSFF